MKSLKITALTIFSIALFTAVNESSADIEIIESFDTEQASTTETEITGDKHKKGAELPGHG